MNLGKQHFTTYFIILNDCDKLYDKHYSINQCLTWEPMWQIILGALWLGVLFFHIKVSDWFTSLV